MEFKKLIITVLFVLVMLVLYNIYKTDNSGKEGFQAQDPQAQDPQAQDPQAPGARHLLIDFPDSTTEGWKLKTIKEIETSIQTVQGKTELVVHMNNFDVKPLEPQPTLELRGT